MKIEITVPNMGESVSEATIGALLKENGAIVSIDEEICELETDKVNHVLFAPQAGKLTLLVKPEQTVKVGDPVAYVDTEFSAEIKKEEAKPAPTEKIVKTDTNTVKEKAPQQKETASSITPSKEGIRFGKEEFLNDLKTPKDSFGTPSPHESSEVRSTHLRESRRKMSKIRKVIASRLVEAQHTTAMLTTFNEVDMTAVMELRAKYKELFEKNHGTRLGFMSFFVKATVAALKTIPELNSYVEGDEIVERNYFDIGIAVGTDRGIIVPVIRDCDQKSVAEIEKTLAQYADKARKGTIALTDLQGGGFTITNGGVYGSLLSTPILNLPQTGILGMHKIEKRAVVIDDQVVIRSMMYLALSYDHRIVDGKGAVTFLVNVKNLLEDPSRLILEV